MQALFDRGILAQHIPRPRQHLPGGLMSGDKERDGLIVQLLRGHLRAVFIHCAHQQIEQVVVVVLVVVVALVTSGRVIVVRLRIFSPPAANGDEITR